MESPMTSLCWDRAFSLISGVGVIQCDGGYRLELIKQRNCGAPVARFWLDLCS